MAYEDDETVKKALTILEEKFRPGATIDTREKLEDYLRLDMGPLQSEVCDLISVDPLFRALGRDRVAMGGLDSANQSMRVIAQTALRRNADGVFLIHNHPHGEPEPSEADFLLTENVAAALAIFKIRLHDHWIIASQGTYSFAREGHL